MPCVKYISLNATTNTMTYYQQFGFVNQRYCSSTKVTFTKEFLKKAGDRKSLEALAMHKILKKAHPPLFIYPNSYPMIICEDDYEVVVKKEFEKGRSIKRKAIKGRVYSESESEEYDYDSEEYDSDAAEKLLSKKRKAAKSAKKAESEEYDSEEYDSDAAEKLL